MCITSDQNHYKNLCHSNQISVDFCLILRELMEDYSNQVMKIEQFKDKAKKFFSKAKYIQALANYQFALKKAVSLPKDNYDAKKKSVLQTNMGLCCYNLNLLKSYQRYMLQAFQTDSQNSKPYFHYLKSLILNSQLAEYQAVVSKYSEFSEEQLKILQFLFKSKKISLEKGFQLSHNWVSAFKKNDLQFGFEIQGLSVKMTEHGIGVFAERDIPPWKIISVERPMLFTSAQEEVQFGSDSRCMEEKSVELSRISDQFRLKFNALCREQNKKLSIEERQTIDYSSRKSREEAIRSNWFAVEQLSDLLMGKEKKAIGSAVYSRSSMFNHRCERNCEYFFIGQWMLIRTVQPIKKGKEVFLTYYYEKQLRERQSNLLKWKILCKCEYCQEQELEERGLLNPTDIQSLRSEEFKRHMLSVHFFHRLHGNPNDKEAQSYLLSTPQTRWVFTLNFMALDELKGKMVALMFKSPQLTHQLTEMFRDKDKKEEDPQMKMLRELGKMMKMPQ